MYWIPDGSEAGGSYQTFEQAYQGSQAQQQNNVVNAQNAETNAQLNQQNNILGGLADTYNQYSQFNQFDPNSQLGNTLSSVYDPNSPNNFFTNQNFSSGDGNYQSIDELIQGRTPEALGILQQGNAQQLGLQRAATQAGLAPLNRMDDMRAFDEQQSLLGLRGEEAQQQAIGGIPISDFERELQMRQQKQQRRGAAARGEMGGGAAFQDAAQLAGAQQSNIIQQRLGQLEPLVALSRGVRSDMSGQLESGAVRQANIQSGLGTQQGNIRLGAGAQAVRGLQDRAEISGLQGIASANAQASRNNQLASLAGSFMTGFK
jgi:hypothetical protein